jgi:HEAT repeat protein
MPIEWVPILSAALRGGATGGTAKAAGWLVEKVKGKVFPSELKLALDKAVDTAQRRDVSLVANQHLFYRCDDLQQRDFLGKVLEASLLLEELQKPIENNGSVDQAVLQLLFQRIATELKADLVVESLPGWIKTFADTYFEQTTAAIRFQVAKKKYLESLERRVDDVKFVGIDVPGEEVGKQGQLVQIFVMPDVRSEQQHSFANIAKSVLRQRYPKDGWNLDVNLNQTDQELLRQEQESVVQRLAAYQVFSNQRSQRKVVLLGVPGSGKSTLVNFFALKICQGQADQVGLDGKRDWLPIVIKIRDLILQPQQSLLDYCRSFAEDNLCAGKLPLEFFEYWLERGQALILFDGLDEVSNETQRKEMAEKIESFVGRYKQNPTLITSRSIGYRRDFFDGREFIHYVLEEFDWPKIETFIENWYNSRVGDPIEAMRCKIDLIRALQRKGQILQLAKNPLLITVISLIHRYQANLPQQRHLLYAKAVSTLLSTWGRFKAPDLESVLNILKPHDWLYVMQKLAYSLHSIETRQDETLISKSDLQNKISEIIQGIRDCLKHDADQEARIFVKFVQERAGLLSEQGLGQYGFVHKTFQEYLTALEIYSQFEGGNNEIIDTTIQDYLHQPHWREVLLLLVGMSKEKRAVSAIQSVLNSDSRHERWLHSNLLFAAWCLTENPQGLRREDKQLANYILSKIFSLVIDNVERVGRLIDLEIVEILKNLAETDFQSDALNILNAHNVPTKRWHLIKIKHLLGDVQINYLLSLFDEAERDIRSKAALLLGDLGDNSEPVIMALSSLCKDDNYNVRSSAAVAMCKLGDSSELVTTALVSLCRDDNYDVRYHAAATIGRLGNSSELVVSALISLCQDNDWVRSSAVKALGKLGNDSEPVITALLSRLGDGDRLVSSKAASALIKLGNTSDQVIDALFLLLTSPQHLVHRSTPKALGKLGKNSNRVRETLIFLLKDNPFGPAMAVSALGELGDGSIISMILPFCRDEKSTVRSSTAEALGKLGNSSEVVIRELLTLCQDSDYSVRSNAAKSLGLLENSSQPVIAALVSLCRDTDFVSSKAAIALGKLDNANEFVISALLLLLKNPEVFVRLSAAEALGALGHSSQQIVLHKLQLWLEQSQENDINGESIDLLKKLVDQSAGVSQATP